MAPTDRIRSLPDISIARGLEDFDAIPDIATKVMVLREVIEDLRPVLSRTVDSVNQRIVTRAGAAEFPPSLRAEGDITPFVELNEVKPLDPSVLISGLSRVFVTLSAPTSTASAISAQESCVAGLFTEDICVDSSRRRTDLMTNDSVVRVPWDAHLSHEHIDQVAVETAGFSTGEAPAMLNNLAKAVASLTPQLRLMANWLDIMTMNHFRKALSDEQFEAWETGLDGHPLIALNDIKPCDIQGADEDCLRLFVTLYAPGSAALPSEIEASIINALASLGRARGCRRRPELAHSHSSLRMPADIEVSLVGIDRLFTPSANGGSAPPSGGGPNDTPSHEVLAGVECARADAFDIAGWFAPAGFKDV